ncbi:prolyl oligopeptidase family serine peptidase [Roseomonas sp. NAR14]|uniref:Prolyl oligopeptidase family serine peptidase n=1 Tax=Roseomonas acroporae TaxID=2937791 RepID=A0A9X1Y696_9PROT|nr:prolyl oligopeptidase family serine peptidase [Roseomonas acroporae]MCK8784779.1 prolyl oligopeptidase family serine peptidase [Roseomonas acroporae]
MATRDEAVEIPVEGRCIPGTLVAPATAIPGILFVQGWGSSQDVYLPRARQIAALGCIGLTFEPRGVARDDPRHETVTREDNLRDLVAAYDTLAAQPGVDASAMGVIGSSYGAYLAAILTSLRPVRWLTLRVPALYRDEDWTVPKQGLSRDSLNAYRRARVSPSQNRALAACAEFRGDVLVVESEHDDRIPHAVVANYLGAFAQVRSLSYRRMEGADHGLSSPEAQRAYAALLMSWVTEMVLGARVSWKPAGV